MTLSTPDTPPILSDDDSVCHVACGAWQPRWQEAKSETKGWEGSQGRALEAKRTSRGVRGDHRWNHYGTGPGRVHSIQRGRRGLS